VGDDFVPTRKGSYLYSESDISSGLLLRRDSQRAFPVVEGIPILMVPEMLHPPEHRVEVDLSDPKYEEAYEEMEFCNKVASEEAQKISESEAFKIVTPILEASEEELQEFPRPRNVWLDSTYDCAAQWDAYNHIAPVKNRRVLQLGGKGAHAVKFLLGGTSEAWVVTPMIGEVRCAVALAKQVGVSDRLRCVVAVAEELPLKNASFDIVFSGGSLHHTTTEKAIPEVNRILKEGGKFAATDPWRAPLYSIGTTIFGKREPDVHCRPLTEEGVRPVRKTFSDSSVIQHGTITRYPLLALNKIGLSVSQDIVWRLNNMDDKVCSFIPGFREMGSSVACLGSK